MPTSLSPYLTIIMRVEGERLEREQAWKERPELASPLSISWLPPLKLIFACLDLTAQGYEALY